MQHGLNDFRCTDGIEIKRMYWRCANCGQKCQAFQYKGNRESDFGIISFNLKSLGSFNRDITRFTFFFLKQKFSLFLYPKLLKKAKIYNFAT